MKDKVMAPGIRLFAGGTIPVHLLTRKAFDTYWQHLEGELCHPAIL
jgi:hypothetical protein